MGTTIKFYRLKKIFQPILVLVLFSLLSNSATADVLVLVHGYHSNASTWDNAGVASVLTANGWQRSGFPQRSQRHSDKIFFTVELPAHAPLLVQTHYLKSFLQALRQQHPDEPLILAGHSAGGVVSRLALLGGNPANVTTLITIASPHQGTYRASQALDIVDSRPFFCPGPGFDLMKSFFGGDDYDYIKHSRGVLTDLLPPASGNVLSWANRQPHPAINYHAVIRYSPGPPADNIVPSYSQDMNQLPPLAGRVTLWPTASGHSLNPGDGYVLATILSTSD